MVFQYVILFNSDRELATTIHEASEKVCKIIGENVEYIETWTKR